METRKRIEMFAHHLQGITAKEWDVLSRLVDATFDEQEKEYRARAFAPRIKVELMEHEYFKKKMEEISE
jgi:hypothetical protein